MEMKKMFHDAKKAGVANESKMWESVEAMAPVLAILEAEHPTEYWDMMRCQHEILYGPHYTEDFAKYDVSQIHWKGKDGQMHHGEHWSKEQVVDATKGMTFPQNTTDCDKFVAFNVFYSDMCKVVADDSDIIKYAHAFFFLDEDAHEGKIWHYMKAMNH